MAASVKTGHVGLNVTNLDRSVEFYRQLFGWELLSQSRDEERSFAFLGREGEILVTLWQQARAGFQGDRAGLHHLSFEVSEGDQLPEYEGKLRSLGAEVLHGGVVSHQEGASSGGLFFLDPDGTRLEIYAKSGVDPQTAPQESAPTCGFF